MSKGFWRRNELWGEFLVSKLISNFFIQPPAVIMIVKFQMIEHIFYSFLRYTKKINISKEKVGFMHLMQIHTKVGNGGGIRDGINIHRKI